MQYIHPHPDTHLIYLKKNPRKTEIFFLIEDERKKNICNYYYFFKLYNSKFNQKKNL